MMRPKPDLTQADIGELIVVSNKYDLRHDLHAAM
jgi:hypothetical protein